MKKLSVVIIILAFPYIMVAQQISCNCLDNLNEAIAKTEINYAGFPTKVNSKTKPDYENLITNIRAKAGNESNAKNCFYLLKDYVRFFKDKHFSLTYLNKTDNDNEIAAIDESYFKTLKSSTGVEGIWTNADSSVTLGIKKFNGNEYKAIILKAKDEKLPKGLVYFTLKPHKKGYLLQQYNVFNSIDFYAQQRDGLLQLWNFSLFGRIFPKEMTTTEKRELNTWKNNNNGLDFSQLDKETSYIKIPTFFNNDNKIEKLVTANDKAIRNSKYLIIDLRGNGGGNSGWSFLLPYVMTNPIKQDSPLLLISKDNVQLKRADLEYPVKNPIPAELKKYYPDEYIAKLQKIYEELPSANNSFYEIPGLTIPIDSVLGKPSRVALIIDELCGSSTEYFFQLMKQSKKTIRYGSNSVGMMDYEGPTSTTPLPCKELILMMPVSKSSWTDKNPIDETGFSPDVKLNIPKKQWVDYIVKDLKKPN
nr:S41 family peptidase [Pedobacter panaciterrae]